MSHKAALARASDALRQFQDAPGSLIITGNGVRVAEVVVSAVMPLIHEPKQMLGVPEGSILIVEIQAGARALRWEDGHLHGNLRADQMPMTPDWVIERYGPLTVVWMP